MHKDKKYIPAIYILIFAKIYAGQELAQNRAEPDKK